MEMVKVLTCLTLNAKTNIHISHTGEVVEAHLIVAAATIVKFFRRTTKQNPPTRIFVVRQRLTHQIMRLNDENLHFPDSRIAQEFIE